METIKSEKKNNNGGLKAAIAILLLLLVASLAYMYKLTADSKEVQTVLVSEKESVLKDLEMAKDSLSLAISSNTTLSDELIAERDKIELLIADVKKAKDDTVSMSKYKDEASKLKSTVSTLLKNVEGLNKQNQRLTIQRDSTVTVLKESKIQNDTLNSQNLKLATTVERGSRLSILGLQAEALRQKSSGLQVATDKAKNADILRISFMIAENQIAKSGDKNYYVQIIDANSNVLGDKKTETFGEKTLTYSFVSQVKYENQSVKITKDLSVKDLKKGSYFMSVYDGAVLMAKSSFTLK